MTTRHLAATLTFIAGGVTFAPYASATENGVTPSAETPPNAEAQPLPSASERAPVQRGRTFLWFEMSQPLGSTHDFAGNFSGRGAALEYRHWVTPQFSWGVRGAWHVLTSKQATTETRGVVTITGTQVRTVNLVPVQATAHYYFGRVGEELAPYVGGGAGVAWAERESTFPAFRTRGDAWQLALSPEVGLILPMDWMQAAFGVRFGYLAPSGDKPEETYVTFGLGLTER